MEVHELKEIIDGNFRELDKRLAVCFKGIDDKNILTDIAIAAIAQSVRTHDHWLWLMRGIVIMLMIALSWIGIKIRF